VLNLGVTCLRSNTKTVSGIGRISWIFPRTLTILLMGGLAACTPSITETTWPPEEARQEQYEASRNEWRNAFKIASGGTYRFVLGAAPENARVRFAVRRDPDSNPATFLFRVFVGREAVHEREALPTNHWRDFNFDLRNAGEGDVVVEVGYEAAFWLSDMELYSHSSDHTNLLLVILDTVRQDKLGVYGYERDTTPHIDSVARKGIVFDRLNAQSPWTGPSVASIFTSTYPETHGITQHGLSLASGLPGFTDTMVRAGYYSMAYVANANVTPYTEFGNSFDYFTYVSKFKGDEALVDLALKGIEGAAGRPWFTYVHLMGPHSPYNPPEDLWYRFQPEGEELSRESLIEILQNSKAEGVAKQAWLAVHEGLGENRRDTDDRPPLSDHIDPERLKNIVEGLYDAELRNTDRQFQRLIDTIAAQGESANTLIAIVADHGEGFWKHGLTHHGNSLFEELIRVPFIIVAPNGGESRRIDHIVQLVDIAPTLAELLDLPLSWPIEGQSLVPLINDFEIEPRLARSSLASTIPLESMPVETIPNSILYLRSLSDGRYKAIWNDSLGAVRFYDLHSDPHEQQPHEALPQGFSHFEDAFAQFPTDRLDGLTIMLCAEPGKDTTFSGTIAGDIPEQLRFRAQLPGRKLERDGDTWRFEITIDGSKPLPYASAYYNPVLFGSVASEASVTLSIEVDGEPMPNSRIQVLGFEDAGLPENSTVNPSRHPGNFAENHPARVETRPSAWIWNSTSEGEIANTSEIDEEILEDLRALGYL
jgi:arylsulfatase A-like enzyme